MKKIKYCPICNTLLKMVYGEPTCPNKECKNYGVYVD